MKNDSTSQVWTGRHWLLCFALVVAGCDRSAPSSDSPSNAAPKSETANTAVASGSSARTEKLPAEPPPRPVVFPAIEQAKVVNFTKLDQLPETRVVRFGPGCLEAHAPGKVPEVVAFYVDQLTKRGWKRGNSGGDAVTDEYASVGLEKDGFTLSLSFMRGGEPPGVSVALRSHGNFDTRKLPRSPGAKPLVETAALTWYVTPTKVPAEAAWVRSALEADGWQAFDRLVSSSAVENDENRMMKLRKHGYLLDVMVGVAPAQNNQTVVQYSVTALAHELPTPPGATDVRFSDDDWELKCKVRGDFKPVAEFYQKAMPAAGYSALSSEEPQKNYWNLRFGTPDEDIILVQCYSEDGKTTLISITGMPAAVVNKLKEREGK